MSRSLSPETRYIRIDLHKAYLVATGVNRELQVVYGPKRVQLSQVTEWMQNDLRREDRAVVEMTTNTYPIYDALVERVASVTVVHPPHVALITRAQVSTDRKSALTLAKLHAAGLLVGIWMPPPDVRDLRAVVAQRRKMVRLRSKAKNRLRAFLNRNRVEVPEGVKIFRPESREWWEGLPATRLERFRIVSDLDTLEFASRQVRRMEACLGEEAAKDERVPLLAQLPGINLTNAMAILGAVGVIERFPTSKKLVGYAGLGARVKDSGEKRRTGRITKKGRRDLRYAMVEAAVVAARTHPRWIAELERLEPRLGYQRAIVAIARKLLVAVWHVLTKGEADVHADPARVAASLFALAYRMRVTNLPDAMSAKAYTRYHLDRMGIGAKLTHIPWGSKRVALPPSEIKE